MRNAYKPQCATSSSCLSPYSLRALINLTMSLGLSIGSLLVASWFAMALTGVLFLQTYIYFRYRPKDDKPAFGILVRPNPFPIYDTIMSQLHLAGRNTLVSLSP